MIDSPSERANGTLSRQREESVSNLVSSGSFTCATASSLKSITGEGCRCAVHWSQDERGHLLQDCPIHGHGANQ